MRGIGYPLESFEELTSLLDDGAEDQHVALPCCEGLREGEWLLVSFDIGGETTAVAGCVTDRGEGARLTFADRDWRTLCSFARCEGPPSAPPSRQSHPVPLRAPPDSSVLVVDDDQSTQHVLCCLLRASGFDVAAVSSAEEAFDELRQRKTHLLVLDWNLPGMTGLDFCRRLRKDRGLSQLPVLFLTAHSSSQDVVAAFEAGADDFVSKPFRAPELGARVFGLLRRTRISEV